MKEVCEFLDRDAQKNMKDGLEFMCNGCPGVASRFFEEAIKIWQRHRELKAMWRYVHD